ncbi:VTT domain-containing protein [Desulfonatronospira sp. MSAO_Bac3]|uniref:VTT domain-containing protein n=1 Tax=Desulfonatronospira sp. MSAO_Bac3 TaxID=2293857 RepID=UPI000FED611B|nr:VTT domain-containing protein [Desulfonatronospira sp. MSAO_Bac3]RQD76559.1 MAG: hypothetical protein D5S03_06010 [Desulfonatronospira sp. MSAO_Bac3]
MSKNLTKLLILAVIASIVAAYFLLDIHAHLTLDNIRASRAEFETLLEERFLTVLGIYLLVYMVVVSLSLPGALPLGLLAGAMFGAITGTIIVSFASTIGATMACFLSRYLLRDWVKSRFSGFIEAVDRGVQKEGALYLFTMRMIPVIPFFIINLAMGITSIRLRTFFWVSQLGMLPGTFVFVNAGSHLGRIQSTEDIFSPGLIISLALIGILPLAAKKIVGILKKKYGSQEDHSELSVPVTNPAVSFAPQGMPSESLIHLAEANQQGCSRCEVCVSQCEFLKKYGMPGDIAQGILDGKNSTDPFECSLCDLCGAICPEKLSPADMFLDMRRQAVQEETVDLSRYSPLLKFEKLGHSNLLSRYPAQKAHTVFFPGCALPGTRPEITWRIYQELKKALPSLDMVLDCCHKPSHDLGRDDFFHKNLQEIMGKLRDLEVKEILVACPNCFKVLNAYAEDFKVKTVYQVMAEENSFQEVEKPGRLAVHDPCPLRYQDGIQDAVRRLLNARGIEVSKMKNSGKKTLCCGEGGAVGFHNPGFARTWSLKRKKRAGQDMMVTYCAGCAGFLSRQSPTIHLADVLFEPEKALAGKSRVSRTPMTYLNRILLKRRLGKKG